MEIGMAITFAIVTIMISVLALEMGRAAFFGALGLLVAIILFVKLPGIAMLAIGLGVLCYVFRTGRHN